MHTPVLITAAALLALGSAANAAPYTQNPNPQEGYRIRILIQDAPGGFAHKKALAQYDVANTECLRPPKHNAGGRSSAVPTYDLEIPLTQLSATEYEAVVYRDAMQNGDFYGHGTCRWILVQFRLHMKATGRHEETLFIPAIPERREPKISTGQTETVYFNKISYPAAQNIANYPNFGAPRQRYQAHIRDADLFSVRFVPTRLNRP